MVGGGGGGQMLISIETHITYDFPGGGSGPPIPLYGSAHTISQLNFSSPEPKAQGELIVWDSSRRPCVRPSTLSNMNISETAGQS